MTFSIRHEITNVEVEINDGLVDSVRLSEIPFSSPETDHEISIQLREYLDGRRKTLNFPLNESKLTDFQKKVFTELKKVPYGTLITYSELASRAATANHRRATAQALKYNPFALILPCHRVVAKNGVGGFFGKIEIKIALMNMEKENA